MGFGNPMENAMWNLDREHASAEYLHPIIIEAEKKTRKIIAQDAIDPQNFIHPYEEAIVKRDVARAEKLRAKYETDEPHKKYADVMEGILYEQIELSNWFGESASTIKTSLYDDYVNHVDLIVELKEEAKAHAYLGLAIDVTFGTTAMQKKFDTIRSEILSGKLTEVKYFESEHSPHKGLYQKLPRVVIGVEREHIIELAAMWLDPKRKKELATHPIQKIILEEIASQLEGFREFAQTGTPEAMALVPIFDRELLIVQKILAEKKAIHSERFRGDRVVGAIQEQIKSL